MTPDNMVKALRGPDSPTMEALFSHKFPVPKGKQPMRRIQFIRHGATALNNDDVSTDRLRGWKDIPLSPDGREEAERLAGKIQKAPPDVILSSDLKRAHDTAKAISGKTGVPIAETSEAFRPWNVGDLAGKPTKEGLPVLAEYMEHRPDEPLPGGETFNQFRDRFFNGLHDALNRHEGDVAIVSHHRNERLLNAWAKAGHPTDGSVDVKEFNTKGEHTGAVMPIEIPMDKLGGVASKPITSTSDGTAK